MNSPKKQATIDESKLFLLNPDFISFVRTGSGQLKDIGTTASIYLEIAIVMLLVSGLYFAYITVQQHNAQTALDTAGVRTQAKVFDRSIDKGKVTYYRLKYRFEAPNRAGVTQTYEGEGNVDVDLFNAINMGTSVEIVYVKGDPVISQLLSEGNSSGSFPINLLLAALLLMMPLPLLVLVANNYFRNRQLERDGKVIIGELIECKCSTSKNGQMIRAKYRFVTPANDEKTGVQNKSRNDLEKSRLPVAGTQVAVLYANDKVYRML